MERNPRTLQLKTSRRENAKLRLCACFEAITIDASDYNFQCRRVSCQISASINESNFEVNWKSDCDWENFSDDSRRAESNLSRYRIKASTPNEFN